MTEFRIVLVTHPDLPNASRLARIIVEEKLCACTNIIPQMHSIYMWKGNLEESSEVLMIIKTHLSCIEALETRLKQLHPYEVFEFVCLPVDYGNESYLTWIKQNTCKDGKNI